MNMCRIIAKDEDEVIRELTVADLPDLARYANNEKLSITVRDAFPNPYSMEDAEKFPAMVNCQYPYPLPSSV